MNREYYSDSIEKFLTLSANVILGELSRNSSFDIVQTQRDAWANEIAILQDSLIGHKGTIYFEYSIPRMGKRIDVLLLIGSAIIILEFKFGAKTFSVKARDQVWDYALDLKNFHDASHHHWIAPISIATQSAATWNDSAELVASNKVFYPLECNSQELRAAIESVLRHATGNPIDSSKWHVGRYCPTPTIIEAAIALYSGHSVREISRSDANAINLSLTSNTIDQIIQVSISNKNKSICFVTGVPGAGKTLVGLNTATSHGKSNDQKSVFLSGNGPLVNILREALARDKVRREQEHGRPCRKNKVMSEVQMFIQNVHEFRDDCLRDPNPPVEHVALFDEAQRAWNLDQTSKFMVQKRKQSYFNQSEPEFLISCLDRHPDWAVIICLVGGGQEINTGEAGISEWIDSLNRSFPDWHIFISSRLSDSEYGTDRVLDSLSARRNVYKRDELHLAVSLRSFRTEKVSHLVKQVLDLDVVEARNTLKDINKQFPIVVTRDIERAKSWLKENAQGSERYGILGSSQAQRLRPYAIDVRRHIDPVHWFLDDKEDVRSSFYLEDVATEFKVQGLELDWVCVAWDADFRHTRRKWEHWSFCGDRWNHIHKLEKQTYLKNAYRVLLTRARQGMVIVVPRGDAEDPTRNPIFYDSTFQYLQEIGFETI